MSFVLPTLIVRLAHIFSRVLRSSLFIWMITLAATITMLVLNLLMLKFPGFPLWHVLRSKQAHDYSYFVPESVQLKGNAELQKYSMPSFLEKCSARGVYMETIYASLDADVSLFKRMTVDDKERYEFWCHERGRSRGPSFAQCITVSIRDGRVFIKTNYGGDDSRHQATILNLYRIAAKVVLPDTDFAISFDNSGLGDIESVPVMVPRRNSQSSRGLLVPDSAYVTTTGSQCVGGIGRSWLSIFSVFRQIQEKIKSDAVGFMKSKINDILGSGGDIIRVDDVPNILNRGGNVRSTADGSRCIEKGSVADMCSHRYLLDIDGRSLKSYLGCGSVVLKSSEPFYNTEWFQPAIPNRSESNEDNEIVVWINKDKKSFSEILTPLVTQSLESVDDRVVKVGKRSQQMAIEVFNEDSIDCYFTRLIQKAAETWGPIGERTGKPIEDVLLSPNMRFSVIKDEEDIRTRDNAGLSSFLKLVNPV